LKALQEENIELANADLAKDRFLASMSHELRTPLNSIIGFTGTMLMKLPGPLTADQQMQLGIVKASAGHLLALINDLLDLAKIEAGKMELVLTPIDLAGVIGEVAASLRPQAQAKGLDFTVAMPASCAPMRSNPRALSQIVINLVNNAIKFTDFGGIRLEMAMRSSTLPRTAEISVADTGVGIPLDAQSELFSAFTRVHVPGHSDLEGTGLGLHLSQKLAEALGGHIAFASEHHKGSKFTLYLPEQ
ncbi:MAG: ATP-binding protein, partial [Xanthobacteraceae bacterium]